jgi:hypothetical protein
MEVFRDLYVSIEPDGMAAVADLIERSPPEGWGRDRAAEGKIRAASGIKPRPTFCFTRTERDARPSATLILAQKDAGTFYVSNVIPVSKHQLAHGEYNAVVEDFYERVIRPHTGTGGVMANLTGSRVELEHWMSAETAEKLRRFSACANRGTGSSHPNDQERWNEFVLAAHRDRSRMDASDLRRWLIEVEGWSPEVAEQLALKYEFGRNLLAFADGYRRSA